MSKLTPWVTLSLALLAASQASANYCSTQKIIEHEFQGSQFKELRLNALAGELYIETSDNDLIEVRGVACTERETYLNRMGIDVVQDGATLELTVIIPYHEKDWHADYAHIDLTLKVPADLNHLIKDSSGDFEAHGIKLSKLNDNSGDVRLRDTTGDLSLRDSAGFVSIKDHTGNLELQDSSGDLDIRGIDGDIEIVRDSSGDIEIEMVSGRVIVDRDSSGDIEIDNVGRSVTVGSDGSGSIRVRDVQGSVEIGSDGSGDIVVQRIDGDFTLERKGSGDIRTAKIQGTTRIPEF